MFGTSTGVACAFLALASAASPQEKEREQKRIEKLEPGELTAEWLFTDPDMPGPPGVAGGIFGGRTIGRRRLGQMGGKQTARAIGLGLDWLACHQDDDGMWSAAKFMAHDKAGEPCDGAGTPDRDVRVTALALLAFLGDGSTAHDGPYRHVVRGATVWLARQQDRQSGRIGGDLLDHAIATSALVEATGLSAAPRLRPFAQRAVDHLLATDGYGWQVAPPGAAPDPSPTGWALVALRQAGLFGMSVDQGRVDDAAGWFFSRVDPATGADQAETRTLRNRLTAMSLFDRYFVDPGAAGVPQEQVDFLLGNLPDPTEPGGVDRSYQLFSAHALYQAGGRAWDRGSKALTYLLKSPRRDGSFAGSWDPCSPDAEKDGRVAATALAVMTLETYYRFTRLIR